MTESDVNPPDTGTNARLREFLRGTGTDHLGRSHAMILAWSDDELEYTHDYIQWLFPLEVASLYHPEAPALSLAQCRVLAQDSVVLAGLRRAFVRLCGCWHFMACSGKVRALQNQTTGLTARRNGPGDRIIMTCA